MLSGLVLRLLVILIPPWSKWAHHGPCLARHGRGLNIVFYGSLPVVPPEPGPVLVRILQTLLVYVLPGLDRHSMSDGCNDFPNPGINARPNMVISSEQPYSFPTVAALVYTGYKVVAVFVFGQGDLQRLIQGAKPTTKASMPMLLVCTPSPLSLPPRNLRSAFPRRWLTRTPFSQPLPSLDSWRALSLSPGICIVSSLWLN
jgi:hypothetical protein